MRCLELMEDGLVDSQTIPLEVASRRLAACVLILTRVDQVDNIWEARMFGSLCLQVSPACVIRYLLSVPDLPCGAPAELRRELPGTCAAVTTALHCPKLTERLLGERLGEWGCQPTDPALALARRGRLPLPLHLLCGFDPHLYSPRVTQPSVAPRHLLSKVNRQQNSFTSSGLPTLTSVCSRLWHLDVGSGNQSERARRRLCGAVPGPCLR